MSKHVSEDDLILYFYHELRRPSRVDRHLRECRWCAERHEELVGALGLVGAMEPPERGDRYGLEVWQRVRHKLPPPASAWGLPWRGRHVAALAAVLGLLVGALAMNVSRRASVPAVATSAGTLPEGIVDRVRAAAVADHLEQTEGMLLDLMNANGPVIDLSTEQRWASELIDANRLFREASVSAGDASVANLLDDVERSLLDVVHGPSSLSPAQMDAVRTRLNDGSLLFKIRVLADQLHEHETGPVRGPKTTRARS